MTALSADTPSASALRWIARLAVLVFVVGGLLPIANWIPSGHTAVNYQLTLDGWLSGAAIVGGGGFVLAIVSRTMPGLWRDGLWGRLVARIGSWWRAAVVVALVALVIDVVVALTVFDGRPLLIDEIVQLYQARIFLTGHLAGPIPAHPEFFSALHLVELHGRVFSQFPAGGPAMLALGEWMHAPWLVNPVFAAISILAWAAYLERTEPRRETAAAAVLLFAFAPFVVFMAGSYMNHVPTLAWLLVAVAALARVVDSRDASPWAALVAGLGFGIAATIRPLDAAAFAVPAGAWLLWRARLGRGERVALVLSGVGVALPILALCWVNLQTTGAPLRFGYQVLWGSAHDLGFHAAPWGDVHTPLRGVELISLYFLRLGSYFLELPVPGLVAAAVALWLARGLSALDRYWLAASALLCLGYFAYWHDGFYLGPRFVYPLAPVLALWTARFLPSLRERIGAGVAYRATVYGALVAAAIALVVNLPIRADIYRAGMTTMRWNPDAAAERAGVRGALVFVRESWGAQIVPRMWAIGISHPDAELLYRRSETCRLDETVAKLEAAGVRDSAAFAQLHPLLADSAKLISNLFSPDTTEKIRPNSGLSAHCIARIGEDRAGFTIFTPLLLARGGGNVYVRDLGARNRLLAEEYPDRPLYLLAPPTARIGDAPVFTPLSRERLFPADSAQPR